MNLLVPPELSGHFHSVHISSVIAVLLRLTAIYWLVAAVVAVIGSLGAIIIPWISGYGNPMNTILFLALPGSYTGMAAAAWFAASKIATLVVAGSDPEIHIREVTSADLYTLGLLVIGAYFFILNLGGMINWSHYLILNRAGEELMRNQGSLSLYEVSSVVIQCVVGAALAVMSPKLGQRLVRFKS